MHRLGLLRWRRSADVPLSDAGGLNPDVTTLLKTAKLQHSRGRTRDHGTPPAMQSCFGSASDAMLGAICRTTVDAPLCAELLKMDLSAQALWQENTHLFADQVAIPRRVQPRAPGRARTVRARCRTCSDEGPDVFRSPSPAIRCFVSLSFLRTPSPGKRGRRLFFRKPKRRTSSYTYGTLRCALPRSDPWSWPSVLRVKGRYNVTKSDTRVALATEDGGGSERRGRP